MKKADIEYFINIAKAVSLKSKDPYNKTGCQIIRKDLTPVSTGYNGLVRGCDESLMVFDKASKLKFTIQAEVNAILFARENLNGCIAIVTHTPCASSLMLLFQAGIREIYFENGEALTGYGREELKAIELIMKSNKGVKVCDKNGIELLEILKNTISIC